MKERYMLVAGGVDKKGIVYNLTKILKKMNFNIEDSSMVMLRRTFSVIMLISADSGKSGPFSREMEKFSGKYGMMVEMRKITEKEMLEYPENGREYMISISGADRPGIVNAITEKIFEAGANIVDLETKSSEKVKPHAYYMFMEVSLPKSADPERLKAVLIKTGKKFGVHVSVSEADKQAL